MSKILSVALLALLPGSLALPSNPTDKTVMPPPYDCSGPYPYHRDDAMARINTFCEKEEWQNIRIAPAIAHGRGLYHGHSRALSVWDNITLADSDLVLWMEIAYTEENCRGTGFNFEKNDCKETLKAILDQCQPGDVDKKLGGAINKGCGVYRMTARPESVKGTPWTLKSTGEVGTFTCNEEGDICWCHYSKFPGLEAPFDKINNACPPRFGPDPKEED